LRDSAAPTEGKGGTTAGRPSPAARTEIHKPARAIMVGRRTWKKGVRELGIKRSKGPKVRPEKKRMIQNFAKKEKRAADVPKLS